jgi:hypothetical protein
LFATGVADQADGSRWSLITAVARAGRNVVLAEVDELGYKAYDAIEKL